MKRLPLFVAISYLVFVCLAQRVPAGAGFGVPWSVVQHVVNSCSTTTGGTVPCAVTVGATTPGNLLIMSTGVNELTSTSGGPSLGSVTGDGTWTNNGTSGVTFLSVACTSTCYYIALGNSFRLSATGGATTVTANWVLPNFNSFAVPSVLIVEVMEIKKTTGSAVLDSAGHTTGTSCTTCSGQALTLTGTADFVIQSANTNGTGTAFAAVLTALTSPYSTPLDIVSVTPFSIGFGGGINLRTVPAPTWTNTNSIPFIASAMAFK